MGSAESSIPSSSASSTGPPNACPVDPAAREAYLAAAAAAKSPPPSPRPLNLPKPSSSPVPVLPTNRVTSSIPRADLSPPTTTPSPASPATTTPSPASPATTTNNAPPSGNWIYPSEKMFFEAMKRKNHSPHGPDMAAVVPIHNAVNERAWSEIKAWEARFAAAQNEGCDGPKLRSFRGDSKKLSPKARARGWVGYEKPFDRHDWVVERCRGEVEYVIDFYRGRGEGLAFFLDVRPKLNCWEGWRMRGSRLIGL